MSLTNTGQLEQDRKAFRKAVRGAVFWREHVTHGRVNSVTAFLTLSAHISKTWRPKHHSVIQATITHHSWRDLNVSTRHSVIQMSLNIVCRTNRTETSFSNLMCFFCLFILVISKQEFVYKETTSAREASFIAPFYF